MRKKIILNKKIGQTPLEVIEEYKKEHPEYKDIKMAYAGRLDPMAEGKLLIVIGEECKNLDKYLGMNKEYIFEILLGFKSDSQDVLGLVGYIQESNTATTTTNTHTNHTEALPPYGIICGIIQKFTGHLTLPYPIFSSKTVKGKQLFLWTLENRLNEIEIPNREVEIYELEFLGAKKIKKEKLQKEIFKKINSIKKVTAESKSLGADFRRVPIRARWREIFESSTQEDFHILKFRCACSSGTYMRVLSEKIAEELGEYGLAYSIKRTKIY